MVGRCLMTNCALRRLIIVCQTIDVFVVLHAAVQRAEHSQPAIQYGGEPALLPIDFVQHTAKPNAIPPACRVVVVPFVCKSID